MAASNKRTGLSAGRTGETGEKEGQWVGMGKQAADTGDAQVKEKNEEMFLLMMFFSYREQKRL